ncbi:hypothetical protein STEG23_019611 [Scotinomys teguina]
MCRLSWFLDPAGWGKAAAVRLYFIFPGICTLSLNSGLECATVLSVSCKLEPGHQYFEIIFPIDFRHPVLKFSDSNTKNLTW